MIKTNLAIEGNRRELGARNFRENKRNVVFALLFLRGFRYNRTTAG